MEPTAATVQSKAEGKKRAVEDDGDATATDEDVPVPGKAHKKKKIQHK
jgi:hypothetical protein